MCGLVGIAGFLGAKEEKVFQNLLIIDSIRGEDSTGVAFINRSGDSEVIKVVGDPYGMIGHHRYAANKRVSNKCIIGHNRFATVGNVKKKNAHPFEFKTIIGAHNGTLSNKYKLQDASQFDTDSEALYHNFEVVGVSNTIRDVEGAYALTWYDKNHDCVNLLRNKERPLTFCLTEDNKTLLWASEGWMIKFLCDREELKIGKIFDLPIDTLFTFKIPEVNVAFEKAKSRVVKQEPPKQHWSRYAEPFIKNTTATITPFRKKDDFIGKEFHLKPLILNKDRHGNPFVDFLYRASPSKVIRCYVPSDKEGKELIDLGMVVGKIDDFTGNYYKVLYDSVKGAKEEAIKKDNFNNPINKKEFESRYSDCAFCTQPVVYETEFKILSKDQVLCEDCASDNDVLQLIPAFM